MSNTAEDLDRLTISDLNLDNGVLAPYVFGERKQQPATVSITLDLNKGVASAASSDALDANTIHYGELAKAVRSIDWAPTLESVVAWVIECVQRMATREDGSYRVGRCVVTVTLPKASMAGECVEVEAEGHIGEADWVVNALFRQVRIMVLIGVNDIERTAKQPLEVDLRLKCQSDAALRNDVQVFGLERETVEIIEPTQFETLESLGEHVVKHLRPKIKEALPSCHAMVLTMRKPKAIAFADAPSLSLTRRIS